MENIKIFVLIALYFLSTLSLASNKKCEFPKPWPLRKLATLPQDIPKSFSASMVLVKAPFQCPRCPSGAVCEACNVEASHFQELLNNDEKKRSQVWATLPIQEGQLKLGSRIRASIMVSNYPIIIRDWYSTSLEASKHLDLRIYCYEVLGNER